MIIGGAKESGTFHNRNQNTMKKLYQALDIQSKHYLTVIKYLNDAGGQVRLVGGVVRDTLLGLPVKDIDMATDFTPAQVTSVLESHGVKIIPTG